MQFLINCLLSTFGLLLLFLLFAFLSSTYTWLRSTIANWEFGNSAARFPRPLEETKRWVFFICWWTTGEIYSRSKRRPPRRINRRATMATMLRGLLHCFWCILWRQQRHLQARHMYYSVPSVSSVLVWTDTLNEPNACERNTFLKTHTVRKRKRSRVNGVLVMR